MTINKVTIKNFKSISELELDFSSMRGLWEITGDVGSGKTTIGEALLYALFGSVRDKNNRELIKWGEKHAVIEMDCFSRGHTIHVRREINAHGSNPTEAYVDGEPIKFTNKRDAQSILETEYYDVPRLSLELLCIITFSGFKSISAMSAGDTKKFLDQTFSLSTITDMYDAACNEKKSVDESLGRISKEQYAALKQIQQAESWKDVDIDELKAEIESKKIQLSEATAKAEKIAKERDEKLDEIRKQISELQIKLSAVKTEGQRKKKDIDFLSKGVCPTCGQKLDASPLEQYKKERDELLRQYSEIDSSIKEKQANGAEIKKEYDKPCTEASKECNDISLEKTRCEEKLRHAQQIDRDIEKLEKEYEDLKLQEESLNVEAAQWQELCGRLSGELRAVILREYIPHINNSISVFMARLGQPYSVTLDESFKSTVLINSKGIEVPVSMLSTGQRKVMDMVIILAVLTVLMNKINFNICFCDELLSNMDRELRDKICELLKDNLKPGQSMFMLCHAPLNKELMDGRILCRLQDGESVYEFE